MNIKSFEAPLENMDSSVYYFHVIIPDDIVRYYLEQNIKRVMCTINNQETIHAAIMPAGKERYFIMINKEIRKAQQIALGDKVHITLVEDKSKYGMALPEELAELFVQDPEGDKVFHTLTPGKQRTLIHMVAKPKRSETRIKKALVILDYLKATSGRLDFKDLNQAFKDSNY